MHRGRWTSAFRFLYRHGVMGSWKKLRSCSLVNTGDMELLAIRLFAAGTLNQAAKSGLSDLRLTAVAARVNPPHLYLYQSLRSTLLAQSYRSPDPPRLGLEGASLMHGNFTAIFIGPVSASASAANSRQWPGIARASKAAAISNLSIFWSTNTCSTPHISTTRRIRLRRRQHLLSTTTTSDLSAMSTQSAINPKRQLSHREWEELKPLIRRLYIEENRTFKDIARLLCEHHNFLPT
jgi:hypothetical protein